MTNPNSGGYPSYGDYPSYGGDRHSGGYSGGYGEPSYQQFEVNSAESRAGADAQRFHGARLTDGYFGDGAAPHPINNPSANGWSHTKGTGKLKIGEAVSWAFTAMRENPQMWLIVGVILSAVSVAAQIPALSAIGVLGGLATLFVMPLLVSMALQQTLTKKFSSPKAPAYGKALGVFVVLMVVFGTAMSILTVIALTVAFTNSSFDPAALPDDPAELQNNPEFVLEILRVFGIAFGLLMLVVLLLIPFITFPMYYAADNNGSFGSALGEGIKAGARNYLPTLGLLLFNFLLGALAQLPLMLSLGGVIPQAVGILLTFLLSIVVAPLGYLFQAHAYRQVSGGPVPHAAAGGAGNYDPATQTPQSA